MTGADELFEYVERQAQLDALRKVLVKLFPVAEENEVIPKHILQQRLLDLLNRVKDGERL